MATNPRSEISDRFELISNRRRVRHPRTSSMTSRAISTVVALVLLALVLRFVPVGEKSPKAHATQAPVQASPADLHFSDVQISKSPSGESLYLDGLMTNGSSFWVTGATAEVEFRDAQGQVISIVQKQIGRASCRERV